MKGPALTVLHEDNHLLVVAKPPDLSTMGARPGRPSLVALAKDYLRVRYDKPGNVYVGVVSRLDATSTGALVLARTSKAARRLTDAFRTGAVEKTYWAVVEHDVDPPEGSWTDWLRKDDRARRMIVSPEETSDAKEARLRYRTLRTPWERDRLLEIDLETGRKHQIRAQLSQRGHPILGDRKYGSRRSFPAGIALHARRLAFEHPVRRVPVEIEAPLPPSWADAGLGV